MPKAVIVDHEKCTGCRICEIVCSTKNEGGVSYERSRIRVYTFPPGLGIPIVCAQCQQAPCIKACPPEDNLHACTARDDALQERMLAEPLPSGIDKGHKLTEAKLNHMLDEYYGLRGWDRRTRIPTKEKLRELKLDFVKS